MTHRWTNEKTIMLDLFRAQGCHVPVDIESVVKGKPPNLKISEDTEEEYYRQFTEECGDTIAPDLAQIQEMLKTIQTIDEDSDNQDTNIVLEPNMKKSNCLNNVLGEVKENKKNNNVAITSLLQAIDDQNGQFDNLNMVKNINTSVILKKRSDYTEAENSQVAFSASQKLKDVTEKNQDTKLFLQPIPMFKKKTKSDVAPVCSVTPNPVECLKVPSTSNVNGVYTPSNRADEHYRELVKKKEIQSVVYDNIWTRAERQMKEIEAKRQLKYEKPTITSSPDVLESTNGLSVMDLVRLPQHRHLLMKSPSDCRVCQVIKLNK